MSPSRPHDKYFRSVFSNSQDAASLIRAYVPEPLARSLRWSTLTLLPGRFVSPDWRDSEADLLFSVEREACRTPVLLFVLLEHQSSPEPWMPLRTLNYCLQVWLRCRSRHGGARGLPLIVPLVLYQGREPWQYEREFAALFTDGEAAWRWVPRFEYVLIDQTRQRPETVPGALPARLAQIAMMAAFRDAREELLESVTRMMGDLYRVAGFEEVAQHVEYVLATQPDEYRPLFVRALRRNVPGRGGDVMNYVEQLIERGRREGLEDGFKEGRREGELTGHREGLYEGELKGRIRTIEGFLGRAVPWSTIEAATGIDEVAFRKLKQDLDATDDGAN